MFARLDQTSRMAVSLVGLFVVMSFFEAGCSYLPKCKDNVDCVFLGDPSQQITGLCNKLSGYCLFPLSGGGADGCSITKEEKDTKGNTNLTFKCGAQEKIVILPKGDQGNPGTEGKQGITGESCSILGQEKVAGGIKVTFKCGDKTSDIIVPEGPQGISIKCQKNEDCGTGGTCNTSTGLCSGSKGLDGLNGTSCEVTGQSVDAQGRTVVSFKCGTQTKDVVLPTALSDVVIARYAASGTTVPEQTSTVVDFSTKTLDTHNAVTTGTAWQFKAPKDGIYAVSARVLFSGTDQWNPGDTAALILRVNGGVNSYLASRDNFLSGSASLSMQLHGDDVVSLQKGDTIDVVVAQTSGVTLKLSSNTKDNYVSIYQVGQK